MIRKEAVKTITNEIKNNPIISANGYISRDLNEIYHKHSNFYMIGSMGLASSIGLGVALKNPRKKIFVFDGDGNILMNLGSLTTIGALKPKNLVHIVFDNSIHESTGGQPTSTNIINIDEIAKSVNYKVFRAKTKNELVKILKKIKNKHGPLMILVKIKKSKEISGRVKIETVEIKNNFMESL